MNTAIRLVERGFVPKPLLRRGIRRLLRDRLGEQREIYRSDPEAALRAWLDAMRDGPVAPVPEKANEQHYEVPPEFFQLVLGKRLKYSSAYYPREETTLDEAEEEMLFRTAERAGLIDGQEILELGCGWGSLTLWMAEQFPESRITAVSNSNPQREHITRQARARGLENIDVITRDMNELALDRQFDRIVSVEMFEHMRNWEELLGRMAGWLRPEGRVFLHFFAHRQYAYPFEVRDESDWMSQHFFTGGMMPSRDLVERVEGPFETDSCWVVSGSHYARTSEDWLKNLERNKSAALEVLGRDLGPQQAQVWYQRWRVFFLSCAELFGYGDGNEWIVSHYRLRLRAGEGSAS